MDAPQSTSLHGVAWQQEYEEFLSCSWEERQHRKQRVANAVAFLRKSLDAPLVKRVEFLLYKGLSQPEIEEAFEIAGQLHELIRILEGSFTKKDCGPTLEEIALELAKQPKTPFRVGDPVWCFILLSQAYLPAVVASIDENRHIDILHVQYGETAHPGAKEEWRAAGFKGVVADIVPEYGQLQPGTAVICRHGDGLSMMDGVIWEVDPEHQCFEVELATCQRLSRVPLANIRTVVHPKAKPEAKVVEVSESAWAPITAVERFPAEGHREREMLTSELLELMQNKGEDEKEDLAEEHSEVDDLLPAERFTFGASIANFRRYPYLNVRARCTHQHTHSDKHFAFDLSAIPHHPECPHLLQYSPILEIARQCRMQDAMYVDAAFPPEASSLWGHEQPSLSTSSTSAAGSFEWVRLSELYPQPHCISKEALYNPLTPGPFSAKWMPPVFSIISNAFEFEILFSPYEGPSFFGCYTVRVHIDGCFWYVLLDDFVPVYTNRTPAFLRSSVHGEIWPALLEKLYAKLAGHYHRSLTSAVFCPEAAFADLSYGMACRNEYGLVSDNKVWLENMLGCQENKDYCTMLAMAPSTTRVSSERKLSKLGIDVGGVQVVQHVLVAGDDVDVQFVLTVDTCNTHAVDPQAQAVLLGGCPPKVLRRLEEISTDLKVARGLSGVWLPFLEHLRLYEACVTLYGFWGWKRVLLHGTFANRVGVNRFLYNNETWVENPQVYVHVFSSGPFCAQVQLKDVRFRRDRTTGQVLRMSLVRVEGPKLATREAPLLVTSNTLVLNGPPVHRPHVAQITAMLEKGHYILVPEVGPQACDEPFVLKIWSPREFIVQPLN